MPKIDIASLPLDARMTYPDPFGAPITGREKKRLGNAVGIDQFGVNPVSYTHLTLPTILRV